MAETLAIIDRPRPGETWAAAIARRLREEFTRRGLSMSAAAKMAGLSQSQFSRRMTGVLPFTIDELEAVCEMTGCELPFILTGASGLLPQAEESLPAVPLAIPRKSIRRRALPGSKSSQKPETDALLPRLESNQQPFGDYLAVNLPAVAGL